MRPSPFVLPLKILLFVSAVSFITAVVIGEIPSLFDTNPTVAINPSALNQTPVIPPNQTSLRSDGSGQALNQTPVIPANAGIHNATSPLGRVAGLVSDIFGIGGTVNVTKESPYLFVNLDEDGTYFKVQDHKYTVFTVDYDKNVIIHKGSNLNLLGTIQDSNQNKGSAGDVLTAQGGSTSPLWQKQQDITSGNVDCTNCINATQLEDLFVFNTGDTITGDLTLKNRADIRFSTENTEHFVAFQAPETITQSTTWTLPSADGSADQVLTTNGAGGLSWAVATGTGANTALSNLASVAINTALVSDTDNTDALGSTAIAWSDLFLGSGGVLTFNSAPSTADITITHSTDTLTFAGGTIVLGTATATGGLTGNVTGNVTGNADTVTTNANLTGVVTSVGNATAIADAALSIGKTSGLQTALDAKEATANKDATGGYAGLTLYKINFKNAANTFTNFFTNTTTAARTYTFPDKDITVAGLVDITGTNSGTNTGDQTITLTGGVTGSGTGSFAATVVTNANLTGPITSVGNATSVASQTGTGSTFVMNTSPTLVTPTLGVASATSLATSAQNIFSATAGTAPLIIRSATATDDDLRLLPFAGGAGRFAGILTSADVTADRTYTFKDASGTVAFTSDITGTNSGTNTGDQTITLTGGVTGSGTGSFAATVVTNANLTGPITSVGNATSVASQTGTGSTFVMNTSPTLVTPALGVATYTTLSGGAITNSSLTSGRVTFATTAGLMTDDADLTFATDTLSATKLLSSTSVSTPSLISTGALTITPAAGSNLNVALSTTGDFAVNTNQLYVDTSAGFVGVGTTAPGARLDVNGNIAVVDGELFGRNDLNITTDVTQAFYYGLKRSNSAFRFSGMKVYNISNAVAEPGSRIGFVTDNTQFELSTERMTINRPSVS